MPPATLRWKRYELPLDRRTAIMGIVNVTPDSFSDGGRFYDVDAAVAQAERMVREGADIIDIGGESTRPYADNVTADEEMARVIPVIERLAPRIPAPISIDTTKAVVAEAALAAGAAMINDISALRMDSQLADVAARYGVPVVLMHMKGTPRTMQDNPTYADLLAEVRAFLKDAMDRATAAGIAPHHVIVDPGIGFGKTTAHNLQLIRQLGMLAELGAPILVGPSRKAFIRKVLAGSLESAPRPDQPEVEIGTQAAVAMAVINGAHIVRVHHAANTRTMLHVLEAIRNA